MSTHSNYTNDLIQEAETYLNIVSPLQQILFSDGFVIFNITKGSGQNGYIQLTNMGQPDLLVAEICSSEVAKGVHLSRSGIEQLLMVGFVAPSEECPNYMAGIRIENNADLEAVASMVQYILETLYQVNIYTEVEIFVCLND